MDIIISAIGTKGDIFPLVGLAKELKDRGNRIIFLTNPKFKDLVCGSEIEFHPTGTIEQYEKFHSNEDIWNPHIDTLEMGFDEYFFPATQDAYNFICQHKNPQMLVLTLGVTNGARIAADQYGIPNGVIALSPNKFISIFNPPAPLCWLKPRAIPNFLSPAFYLFISILLHFKLGSSYIKRIHKKLNIKSKAYSHIYNYKKESLLIGLLPEWFGMRARDWPSQLKLVGFPLCDSVNIEAREKIDAFIASNGAPIIFTTGTGVNDTSDVFREGKKICENLNIPGVFAGGNIGKELLEGSDLCMHVDYIDFEYILPKSKAIVHHGGIGTTAQAIKAGVPQLIRPLSYDQPDNANRIHKLGLGTFLLPENFNSETASKILKALIETAPTNKNLMMYSNDLKRSNAIKKACDLIESKIHSLS